MVIYMETTMKFSSVCVEELLNEIINDCTLLNIIMMDNGNGKKCYATISTTDDDDNIEDRGINKYMKGFNVYPIGYDKVQYKSISGYCVINYYIINIELVIEDVLKRMCDDVKNVKSVRYDDEMFEVDIEFKCKCNVEVDKTDKSTSMRSTNTCSCSSEKEMIIDFIENKIHDLYTRLKKSDYADEISVRPDTKIKGIGKLIISVDECDFQKDIIVEISPEDTDNIYKLRTNDGYTWNYHVKVNGTTLTCIHSNVVDNPLDGCVNDNGDDISLDVYPINDWWMDDVMGNRDNGNGTIWPLLNIIMEWVNGVGE